MRLLSQTHADDVRKLGVDLISGTGDRDGFYPPSGGGRGEKRQIEAIDQPLAAVFRGPARRRPGAAPGRVEGGGRVRQLLYLLHHSIRPGRCGPARPHWPWSRLGPWRQRATGRSW